MRHMTGMNLSGQKFGKLLVTKRLPNKGSSRVWECLCDCGSVVSRKSYDLANGVSASCGCINKRNAKHGKHGTPEYCAYHNAKSRCTNPDNMNYEEYGGRGIKFLFTSFNEFYDKLGPRPSHEHSLDRIDNNGNYEPKNCRWSTKKEQVDNRRLKTIDKFSTEELLLELTKRTGGTVA